MLQKVMNLHVIVIPQFLHQAARAEAARAMDATLQRHRAVVARLLGDQESAAAAAAAAAAQAAQRLKARPLQLRSMEVLSQLLLTASGCDAAALMR